MRSIGKFGALLSVVIALVSCRNEFEVNTPYTSTMVVYGILDPGDTAHYVKVERSFLGEGDAYAMAQEFDSLNYSGGIAVMLERIRNGNLVQTIPLALDSTIKRDPGIFSWPTQYVYKTAQPLAQDGSIYRLKVLNETNDKEVTGQTPIVQPFSLLVPSASNNTINFVDPVYPFTLKWNTVAGGRVYEPRLRMYYDELLLIDTTQVKQKYIDWSLGSMIALDDDGGEVMQLRTGTNDFYSFLSSRIAYDGSVKRRVRSIQVIFTIGADDLHTYMQVSQANLGSSSEDIVYTNISGGIGLFSSRLTWKRPVQLSPVSLDSLIEGSYTYNLGFTR
jgi:hypothetical protein